MPSELPERRCGRCEHFVRYGPNLPRGTCGAPFPKNLPSGMEIIFKGLSELEGMHCPAFETKEGTATE